MRRFTSITLLLTTSVQQILFSSHGALATKNEESEASTPSFDDVLDDEEIIGSALDSHPDPNDENYEGMIYIGRHEDDGTRMGFDKNNGALVRQLLMPIYNE